VEGDYVARNGKNCFDQGLISTAALSQSRRAGSHNSAPAVVMVQRKRCVAGTDIAGCPVWRAPHGVSILRKLESERAVERGHAVRGKVGGSIPMRLGRRTGAYAFGPD